MKKLTRNQFIVLGYAVLSVIALIGATLWETQFPGDTYKWNAALKSKELVCGAVHGMFNFITIVSWIAAVIVLSLEWSEDPGILKDYYINDSNKPKKKNNNNYNNRNSNQKEEEEVVVVEEEKPFNYRKFLIWTIVVILGLYFFGCSKKIFNQSADMYNKSKICHNNYTQKVDEKKGFYDKQWKTYRTKENIANFVTKDVFITVTKIIMDGRKDGQQVTWKWLQENQQIPYSEFTKFYTDLSSFIEGQREGYFNIEKQCQVIANQNNTLLDTFPNNIYNKVLSCERIKFEYGFTSDSTETVFKKKIEN